MRHRLALLPHFTPHTHTQHLLAPQVKRKPEVLDALKFIHSTAWPAMWGRPASDLQQANAADDEYMITDNDLPVSSGGGQGVGRGG